MPARTACCARLCVFWGFWGMPALLRHRGFRKFPASLCGWVAAVEFTCYHARGQLLLGWCFSGHYPIFVRYLSACERTESGQIREKTLIKSGWERVEENLKRGKVGLLVEEETGGTGGGVEGGGGGKVGGGVEGGGGGEEGGAGGEEAEDG